MTQTENPCDCVWASLQFLWPQHVTNVSSANKIKQMCRRVTVIILTRLAGLNFDGGKTM